MVNVDFIGIRDVFVLRDINFDGILGTSLAGRELNILNNNEGGVMEYSYLSNKFINLKIELTENNFYKML